jgi:hypothetical protein
MRQVLITQIFRFGSQATFASNSNFGQNAGRWQQTQETQISWFKLGYQASTANNSNFFGVSAGYKATSQIIQR